MRVLILGGTNFIGFSLCRQLLDAGHEVAVVHRGQHEPEALSDATHIHSSRAELSEVSDQIKGFRPDVVMDAFAMSKADAEIAVKAIGPDVRRVMWSSMDVYRGYSGLHHGYLSAATK